MIAKEPYIFSLLKTALYYSVPSTKEIDLLDHEAFAEVWANFEPHSVKKSTIQGALTHFIGQFNVRDAVRNLATNEKYGDYDKSAQTLNFKTYLEIGGIGDIFPYKKGTHLIVPPKLFRKEDPLLPFFGTAYEMTPKAGPSSSSAAANSSSGTGYSSFDALSEHQLCVTRDGHTHLFLPFSIEREEVEIDYEDPVYKELDKTAALFQAEATRVTLTTHLDDDPISVTVVYPKSVSENDSWLIALSKSRVYETMMKGAPPPPDTYSSMPSSSSKMVIS